MRERYRRTITAIDGKTITVNAPISSAFTREFGGGTVTLLEPGNPVENAGIEHMRFVAVREFDASGTDTRCHMHSGVTLDLAKNCWVSDVYIDGFYGSALQIGYGATACTIEDCHAEMPPHKEMLLGGYWGGCCYAVNGYLNLVMRNTSSSSRHPFVAGSAVGGPNAFVFCDGNGASELHHRYSIGFLFDCCGLLQASSLALIDRSWMGSGHGWCAANSVIWNCVGDLINCESPPIDNNWVIGGKKLYAKPGYHTPASYEHSGQFVAPQSLYLQQLKDRLGQAAVDRIWPPEATERYARKNWCDLALDRRELDLPDADYRLYPSMTLDYREDDLLKLEAKLEQPDLPPQERAEALLEQGKIWHLRKQYTTARQHYRQAMGIEGGLSVTQRRIAGGSVRDMLIEQGMRTLHSIAPKDEHLIDTKRLFTMLNAPSTSPMPDVPAAERARTQAILDKADVLYKRLAFADALPLYRQVAEDLEAHPHERSRALLWCANIYKIQKRFDIACQYFRDIITMEHPRPYDKRIALKDFNADFGWAAGKMTGTLIEY
jgi:hypothetical protein